MSPLDEIVNVKQVIADTSAMGVHLTVTNIGGITEIKIVSTEGDNPEFETIIMEPGAILPLDFNNFTYVKLIGAGQFDFSLKINKL